MELMSYAESELARIPHDQDGMQDLMDEYILEIIKTFGEQGHSGFSADYAISVLERLLRFKPITLLTGEDDEWEDTGYGTWQNKRCSSVFKESDGTCHDIESSSQIMAVLHGLVVVDLKKKSHSLMLLLFILRRYILSIHMTFLLGILAMSMRLLPISRSVSRLYMSESVKSLTK